MLKENSNTEDIFDTYLDESLENVKDMLEKNIINQASFTTITKVAKSVKIMSDLDYYNKNGTAIYNIELPDVDQTHVVYKVEFMPTITDLNQISTISCLNTLVASLCGSYPDYVLQMKKLEEKNLICKNDDVSNFIKNANEKIKEVSKARSYILASLRKIIATLSEEVNKY